MRADYTLPRLYLDAAIEGEIDLPREQAHYLGTVLRKRVGEQVRVFNARDGEWAADIVTQDRKSMRLSIAQPLREPKAAPDVRLLFAPIRKHRTATVFEKATELGVRTIQPVITEHTQFPKLNIERAMSQIIEAAEQTERLDLPELYEPIPLDDILSENRSMLFADEAGDAPTALAAMDGLSLPIDVLIGPEGGFTEAERQLIRGCNCVTAISLGPRILRADTAAISLLTLVQAKLGDWQQN